MHLIVPYAFSPLEACTTALQSCKLPILHQLMGRLASLGLDAGHASDLSLPHERVQARLLGLPARDGLIPWAAWQARQNPALRTLPDQWAFISLCHWQVHSHHIAMTHWPMNDLSEDDDAALRQAMAPYFAEDGITLHADQPGRWLANGALLAHLASASPERVLGRDLKPWMPDGDAARPLRRLQNEMQMLLYTHPVNDARQAQGRRRINSFWVHGSGPMGQTVLPAEHAGTLWTGLQAPALRQDWAAWARAWQTLDAGALDELRQVLNSGQPVQLTLCGERQAQSWQSRRSGRGPGLWQALRHKLAPPSTLSYLDHL